MDDRFVARIDSVGNWTVISTADLGQPRIVEEYFENPDGSPIVVDRDITGAARGACSARGPLAAYGDGEVLIWSK